MNNHVLLVGDDTFFQSNELDNSFNTIQVQSIDLAITLVDRFDFQAIIAQDGSDVLKAVREQGKHTPFLNISHSESITDCCGGGLSPEANLDEKVSVLHNLINRNHQTDCR